MQEVRKPILLADDEADWLDQAKPLFERRAFDVDTTNNGVDAVKRIKGNGYLAAILDLRMPRLDGVDAAVRINHLKPGLPIFFLTAVAEEFRHRAKRKDVQVAGWVDKPLPVDAKARNDFFDSIKWAIFKYELQLSHRDESLALASRVEQTRVSGDVVMKLIEQYREIQDAAPERHELLRPHEALAASGVLKTPVKGTTTTTFRIVDHSARRSHQYLQNLDDPDAPEIEVPTRYLRNARVGKGRDVVLNVIEFADGQVLSFFSGRTLQRENVADEVIRVLERDT